MYFNKALVLSALAAALCSTADALGLQLFVQNGEVRELPNLKVGQCQGIGLDGTGGIVKVVVPPGIGVRFYRWDNCVVSSVINPIPWTGTLDFQDKPLKDVKSIKLFDMSASSTLVMPPPPPPLQTWTSPPASDTPPAQTWSAPPASDTPPVQTWLAPPASDIPPAQTWSAPPASDTPPAQTWPAPPASETPPAQTWPAPPAPSTYSSMEPPPPTYTYMPPAPSYPPYPPV